jgi:hypothetical protein
MNNDLIKPLILHLGTKERLHLFLQQLDACLQTLSKNVSFDPVMAATFFSSSDFLVLSQVVSSTDDIQILRKSLLDIPLFTLHLSFYPDTRFLDQIVTKIQKNELCFVEVLINQSIIAGAICDFKGVYKDYSVRRSVEQWRKERATHYAS